MKQCCGTGYNRKCLDNEDSTFINRLIPVIKKLENISSLTKHYVLTPVSLLTPALTKCQHLDISIPSTEKSEFLFKITQFAKAVATTMNQKNKQTKPSKQKGARH